jgi:nucleoid-associated protein YgaU
MGTSMKFGKTYGLLSLIMVSMVVGAGCSSHHGAKPDATTAQSDEAPPPPDAGTDAVPQAAAEEQPPADPNAPPPAPIAENADPNAAPAPIVESSGTPEAQTQAQAQDQTPPAASPDVATAPVPPAPEETQVPPGMNNSGPGTPDQAQAEAPAPEQPAAAVASGDGTYTVHQGDTLMKIAFENYGDLYKWKEIYEANKDVISDPNKVPPGTKLKLDPSSRVSVATNGSQYMIKSGDTLGTISNDVYGTKRKWKRLWENNKQLIHDPNRIYAGFFLYYTLTPAEREDFKRRKGAEPPETSNAPLAQSSDDQPAAPQPAAAAAAPAPAGPAPASVPAVQTNAPRAPAALMVPPPVSPIQGMVGSPSVPSVGAPPPMAEHSADLNEVIQQAQKDEAAQAAPAAAGP